MKYTGKIKLHTDSPFFPDLLAQIERKVFAAPTSILNWYWHAHNESPLEVLYEKHTHPMLAEHSTDRYIGLWLRGDAWAPCSVYSYSHKRGIAHELEFTGPAQLSTVRNTPIDSEAAFDFWRERYTRSFEIVMQEQRASCAICKDPQLETYTAASREDLVRAIRKMYSQADLAVFRKR